jgi:hypothetical protein
MYSSTITARYDGANFDVTNLAVTVLPAPNFVITATSPSVTQGSSAQLTINATNTGNCPMTGMTYTITKPFVSGSNTLSFSETGSGSMTVAYGSYGQLTATFSPSESVPAGTYTGQISVTYGSVTKTLSLSITVSAIVRDVSVVTSSPRVVMDRTTNTTYSSTTGTFNITNTGNTAIMVVLSPSSFTYSGNTITSGSVSLSSSAFPLSVGETKNVVATVGTLSGSLPDGTYSGTITTTYSSTPESIPFSIVIATAAASISPDTTAYAESGRDVDVSKIFTITNNGDLTLTGCALTTTAASTTIVGSIPSQFTAGSSATISVTSHIPEYWDTGVSELGKIRVTCSGYTKDISLQANVLGMLEIDSVKVSIADDSWTTVGDGETYDDKVYPGDKFETKMKLTSNFNDDNGNLDIEDVQVEAYFYGVGTDGDDIEGEIDSIDIEPGKDEEVTITWDEDSIDWDIEPGNYLMELIVTGEDEEGAEHTAIWQIYFEITRDSDSDFRITALESNKMTLQKGASFDLLIEGKSIGEDSDDVIVKIFASGLSINENREFEMGAYDSDEDCNALESGTDPDEDDLCNSFSIRRSYTVPVDAVGGTQQIRVEIFAGNDEDKMDEKTLELTVTDGAAASSTTTTGTTSSTTTTTTKTTTSAGSAIKSTTTTTKTTTVPKDAQATTSSIAISYGGATYAGRNFVVPGTTIKDMSGQSGFSDSMGYVALLSILGLVILLAIVGLIAYAMSGERD